MIYKSTVSGNLITAEHTIGGQLHTSQLSLTGGLYLNKALPAYTGAYEFTPTNATQVIEIAQKGAKENIIINPIPSNYGLITWNGSVLTVS